jgi:DNA repair protein RadC
MALIRTQHLIARSGHWQKKWQNYEEFKRNGDNAAHYHHIAVLGKLHHNLPSQPFKKTDQGNLKMISSIVQKNGSSYQEEMDAEKLISSALHCLETRLRYKVDTKFNNSHDVCVYARLQLAQEQDEVFAAMFLNNHHQLLAFEKLFYGTINESTVYPRKVVKKSLEHNAAKLIIAHNHPSGNCTPSEADKEITQELKKILKVIDIQLVDHVVTSHEGFYSFAEHGLL